MKLKTLSTLMLTSLFTLAAHAVTPEREEELIAAYMACEKMASESMLSGGDAAICSEVHEALLTEVFEGDFNKLLEWWKKAKAP